MRRAKYIVNGRPIEVTFESQAELAKDVDRLRSERGADVQFVEFVGEKAPKMSKKESAMRGAGAGMLFGFDDEIGGFVDTLHTGMGYEEARDRRRKINEMSQRDNPKTHLAGELGGGMLLPGVGAIKGGQMLTKAASPVARGVGLLGIGATEGAISGAGYSDKENWGEDAFAGGVLGGIMGPALGLGLPAAANLAGRGLKALGRGHRGKAERIVAKKLKTGGRTADDVVEQMDEMGPAAWLSDVDEDVTRAAGAAMDMSDDAALLGKQRIAKRREGTPLRVQEAVEEATGHKYGTYDDTYAGLKKERQLRGQEDYAFIPGATVQNTPKIQRTLKTPRMQELIDQNVKDWQSIHETASHPLYRTVKEIGEDGKEVVREVANEEIPLDFLQALKIKLDKAAGFAKNPMIDSSMSPSEQVSNKLRKRVLGAIEEEYPEFAQANKVHSTLSKRMEAMQAGLDTASTGSKPKARAALGLVEGFDPVQQADFRHGATQGLLENMVQNAGKNPNYGNRIAPTRMGGSGPMGLREQLLEASVIPGKMGGLLDRLGVEDEFFEAHKYLDTKTNSKTAARLASVNQMTDTAKRVNSVISAIGGGIDGLIDLLPTTAGERTMTEVANILFQEGITEKEIRRLMKERFLEKPIAESLLKAMGSKGQAIPASLINVTAASAVED